MHDISKLTDQLRQASEQVCVVFDGQIGLDCWGDPLAVNDGHDRPARLSVWELSLDECYYFFTEARYRTLPGADEMAHAVRYFLPRFARHFADPLRDWGPDWLIPSLGSAIGHGHWWNWPEARVIDDWVCTMVAVYLAILSLTDDEMHRQQCLAADMHTAMINAGPSACRLSKVLHRQDASTSAAIVHSLLEYEISRSRMRLALTLRPWVPTDDPELLSRQHAASQGIADWLNSLGLRSRLERAVLDGSGGERESSSLNLVEQWVAQPNRPSDTH